MMNFKIKKIYYRIKLNILMTCNKKNKKIEELKFVNKFTNF